MDVSPKQLVSVAASLIPFLENDDANRALMDRTCNARLFLCCVPKPLTSVLEWSASLREIPVRLSSVSVPAS